MSSPLPPRPGETPEQRRARLNAAYEVQARIDAQRQAELEAQEQARRKEMQARIDNMLRFAYVLPPLPSLPAPMPPVAELPMMQPPLMMEQPTPLPVQKIYEPRRPPEVLPSPVPSPAPMPPLMMDLPPLPPPPPKHYDTFPSPVPMPIEPLPPVAELPMRPPLMLEQPTPPPVQKIYEPQRPPVAELPMRPPLMMEQLTPPVQKIYEPRRPPVDPGFVIDIPTMQPPMPLSDNVGLIDNRIGPGFGKPMQPTPSPIDNLSSSIRDALLQLQPSAPGGVDYGQPAQPTSGMGLSRLAPEPYTPPVFEPYTPPSMQFSVDMPRVDYARDMYSVNPNEVSMLKMGGLAVKSKKGKC